MSFAAGVSLVIVFGAAFLGERLTFPGSKRWEHYQEGTPIQLPTTTVTGRRDPYQSFRPGTCRSDHQQCTPFKIRHEFRT